MRQQKVYDNVVRMVKAKVIREYGRVVLFGKLRCKCNDCMGLQRISIDKANKLFHDWVAWEVFINPFSHELKENIKSIF